MVPYCYSHVAVLLNNDIIVIGGFSCDDRMYPQVPTDVIWMYNIYTDQWKKYQIPGKKNAPPALSLACAIAIGTHIQMFGGYLCDSGNATNDMWKLTRSPQGRFAWSKIEFQHDAKLPSPRHGHSGWKYNNCLWVFGGAGTYESDASKYLNDHGDYNDYVNNQLLCYDPSTQMWTNPQCFGSVPCPRFCHSTEAIRDKVWLFAGKGMPH